MSTISPDQVKASAPYDICGNNRFLFDSLLNRNKYVGIDLFDGKNVDIVGRAHEILATHNFEGEIDVIVSTEALEHDATWKETLMAIYSKVKNGGMILLTAAGEGREEHGTHGHNEYGSPATLDYYNNITFDMMTSVYKPNMFSTFHLEYNEKAKDIYFYGIKKDNSPSR